MSTTWTNETNGSITTSGNILEATTLSVTGTATANTLSTSGVTISGTTISCGSITASSDGVIGGVTLASDTLICDNANIQVECFLKLVNSESINLVSDGTDLVTIEHASDLPSIKMLSEDGTASYLFVANDGTLRISSTQPTANGDGNPV